MEGGPRAIPPGDRGGSRRLRLQGRRPMKAPSLTLLSALLLSGSMAALSHGAFAEEAPSRYCGDSHAERPCGPLADDGSWDRAVVGRNLERGGAGGAAFRVSVDGESDAAGEPAAADRQRQQDLALDGANLDVQVTALEATPVL